jgi:predicted RNA methylase
MGSLLIVQKIPENILSLLEQCTVQGNELVITCGQLERKTYEALNKVIVALGGKWNWKAGAHLFPDDPSVRVEEALLTGEYSDKKKDFGFFETPKELAEIVADRASISPDHKILEPSAGKGRLANAAQSHASFKNIYCIEILPEYCNYLKGFGYKVRQRDFLLTKPKPVFDRVIMNPPFSVAGRPQADIDHVLHAFECLKPGGRLVSIMGAGVRFRQNKKTVDFRKRVKEIRDNPPDSFKISGTSVNTVIVIMEK